MSYPIPHYSYDENDDPIERHLINYMPADNACKTVELRDGKPFFGPVICWEICTFLPADMDMHRDVCVMPVTPNGPEHLHVLFPDGTVRLWDSIYADVDAWLQGEIEFNATSEKMRKEEAQPLPQNAPK